MRHKDKLAMARRMLTREEVRQGVPPFLGNAWSERKEAIKKRIARKEKHE